MNSFTKKDSYLNLFKKLSFFYKSFFIVIIDQNGKRYVSAYFLSLYFIIYHPYNFLTLPR